MTRVRAASLLGLAMGAGLWACNGTSNPDASDGNIMGDVAPVDGAVDGSTDTPVDMSPPDGSVVGMCGTTPVVNLNAVGTRTNNVLDYTSSVPATVAMSAGPIQPTSALQGTPTTPGFCAFHIGREQIFAYTAQAASVLRISTTNPGTDSGFDTVLYVRDATNMSRACSHTAATDTAFLGCNDDDLNYSGDQRRISSTATLIKQVTAGQTVYIAFGGFEPTPSGAGADMTREQGAFELTVTELTPVALGGACDVVRVANPCADGATCVSSAYPSGMGTCVANGSVAGAACGTGSACMNGMTCSATTGACTATVTAGATCDPYHTCDATSSCVQLERGGAVGVCRALGSVIGAQCDATNSCAAGLACQMGTQNLCLPSATTTCSTFDTACAAGNDCVGTGPSGTAGACTPTATSAGTHCTATCNTGLACQTMAAVPFCANQPTAGQPCNQYDICANGGTCFLTDLTNGYGGTCFDPGTLGGPCGMGTTVACPTGTTCSVTGTTAQGRCLNMAADGAVCTLTDACPTGDVCVQDNTTGPYAGHCHAQGSVAGAQCVPRGAAPCATGLTCSSWIPEEGTCQSAGTMNGPCNVQYGSIRCPGTQVCRSASIHTMGTCSNTTAEVEPNDQPWTASTAPTPIAVPAAIAGGLTIGDVDCFPVTLHANQHLYAAATSPSGVCGALNLLLSVYRYDATLMAPRLLGSDNTSGTDRCPRVEGTDTQFSWAQNTGTTDATWYVCLNNNAPAGGAVQSYVLSLGAN